MQIFSILIILTFTNVVRSSKELLFGGYSLFVFTAGQTRSQGQISKVLVAGKKKRQPRPPGHYAPKLYSLALVFELKIVVFVLNYLTVLAYTKTIIHLSVGG